MRRKSNLVMVIVASLVMLASAAWAATPFTADGQGGILVKEGYFLSNAGEITSNAGGTGYYMDKENILDCQGNNVLRPDNQEPLKISNWEKVFKRTPFDFIPVVKEKLDEAKIQELFGNARLQQAGNLYNAPEGSRVDCQGSLWFSTGNKLDNVGWILNRSPLLIGENGGIHVVTGKQFPNDKLITSYTGKTLDLDTVYRESCNPNGVCLVGETEKKSKVSKHEKAIAAFIKGISVNPEKEGSPITEAAVAKKLEQIAMALKSTGVQLEDIPVPVLDLIERDIKDGSLSMANREAIIALGAALGREPQEIARYLEEAENPLQARLTAFSNKATVHGIYLGEDTTSFNQHIVGGVRDIFDQIFFEHKISALVKGPNGQTGHIIKKRAWKIQLDKNGIEIDRIELKPGFDLQVGREAKPTLVTRDGKLYKSIDNYPAESQTDEAGNWLTTFGYLGLASAPPVIHQYEKPGQLNKLTPLEGVDSKLSLSNILGLHPKNDSEDFVNQGVVPVSPGSKVGNNGLGAGYSFVAEAGSPLR